MRGDGDNGTGIVARKERTVRRMTMYLDPALAKRVLVFCAEHDREISEVAADALKRYLSERNVTRGPR